MAWEIQGMGKLHVGRLKNTSPTWWFKVPFLGWLSDPFKGLSDLQLGDSIWIYIWVVVSIMFLFSPRFFGEMIPNLTVRIFFKRVRKNQLVISIYFRLGVPCLLKGSVYDVWCDSIHIYIWYHMTFQQKLLQTLGTYLFDPQQPVYGLGISSDL